MKFYEETIKRLNTELDTIESGIENPLFIAEKGIKLVKTVLSEVRTEVLSQGFQSQVDEINFFKNIKPYIYSKLVYYAKLFNLESKRPRGSRKTQVKYFNSHIDKLQTFFNENLDFYHYYRRGATSFDKHYFLRSEADIRLFPENFHFFEDEKFSTSHDNTVATILAYDLLIIHLKREIDKLENNRNHFGESMLHKRTRLTWTAHKIYLIELIYALHSTDAINNGTADIKDIAYFVERIFRIDLGDYYRAFLEIRMRKNGRTKFLDILKEELIKRMDETDN